MMPAWNWRMRVASSELKVPLPVTSAAKRCSGVSA
jgi:hypothetical protein